MKILVVEDDRKTAAILKKGLQEQRFVVDIAENGENGLEHLSLTAYDLLLLDIMLPGRDGWSLVHTLRERKDQIPILLLTARDSVDDRVKGLEMGADDYLVKPFAFSELLARVRSLLRRSPVRQDVVLRVADLVIDLSRHRVTRAGHILTLTPKEFLLVSLLARHQGEVLSRTYISEQVWDMNFDSDTNIVDVHIRRLRSKVDEGFSQKLIHTIRGAGYVLEDKMQ